MKKFKKIYVEITNRCNLNCSFCSLSGRKKEEMGLKNFEILLQKINNYTDYLYLHVKGEPLIHSEFRKILELCRKHNKKVNITTNGSLLKKRLSDIIDSKVVRQINISMQSLQNTAYLDDILESVDEIHRNTNIQTVFRFWALDDNRFTDFQKEIIDTISDHYNFGSNLVMNIVNNDNIKLMDRLYLNKDRKFVWPSFANDYCNSVGTCYGGRTHIAILVDGTIVPCCLDGEGIINFGNIFTDDLEAVLNSNRFKDMVRSFQNNKMSEELCCHCSFKDKLKKGS